MVRPLGASGERREEIFIVIGGGTGFEELAAAIVSAATAAAVIQSVGKCSCALWILLSNLSRPSCCFDILCYDVLAALCFCV